jgi:hypothetical protein
MRGLIMKKLLSIIAALLLYYIPLSASTPYNLEGIRALRVLIIDTQNTISPESNAKIVDAVKKKLKNNGIKSEKEGVGALYVKLTSAKVGETTVVHINFSVGEETEVLRSYRVPSFALTYSFDDMIDSKNVEADVYDSIVNFLTEEFLDQFHEDNEE